MARSMWRGSISFGLVNVPVRLYSSTEDRTVHFHQLEEGTGQRIRYRRVAEESGEEVGYENIVKGYELDDGRMVVVTPEELESVDPEASRTIDIEDFVDLDEIDPIYYRKTYFLEPGEGAERPYALLRRAMEDANRVGIARFVMRGKQYLAAIRPSGTCLLLETMFFGDEVRSPEAMDNPPQDVEVGERELEVAAQLVDSLTTGWDPSRYQDTHRERVLELIERKAEGEDVVAPASAPEPAKVVDLMAALEASVARARPGGGNGNGRSAAGDGAGGEGRSKLAEMSREELYEEAQRRDVSGRSKMSKDELIEALQEAS